jgi:hypothetical protein
VHDATPAGPDFFHYLEHIVVGLAAVDHNGQFQRQGQLKLSSKRRSLRVARAEIIVIVEANLADGNNPLRYGHGAELPFVVSPKAIRIVRMNSDGSPDVTLPFRNADAGFGAWKVVSDCKHPLNASVSRTLEDAAYVTHKLLMAQMAVRVDHVVSGTDSR